MTKRIPKLGQQHGRSDRFDRHNMAPDAAKYRTIPKYVEVAIEAPAAVQPVTAETQQPRHVLKGYRLAALLLLAVGIAFFAVIRFL